MKHLGNFHFKFRQGVKKGNNRIVAIDTEWAKNWRNAEKAIPFCGSCHSIYLDGVQEIIDIDNLCMESELYF
ncbi:hypothetical protein ACFL2L_01315, partial [Patescibacteria group bacterium]